MVIAGPGRCGSTAQYNAIRIMLERAFGKDNIYVDGWSRHVGNDNKPDRGKDKKHNLVKHHWPSEAYLGWADTVFTARRCLLDTMASDKRATKCTNTKEMLYEKMAGTILCHEWWRPYTVYDMPYEEWHSNPQGVVDRMAAIVGAETGATIDTTDIAKIVNSYTNSEESRIPNSLYSFTQRTDGGVGNYAETLEGWEIAFVSRWGSWYQRKYDYPCS